MSEKTYVQAMNEALVEEMKRDEKVFLVGESIRGGSFGVTSGIVRRFGKERVLDTPISETGVAGTDPWWTSCSPTSCTWRGTKSS